MDTTERRHRTGLITLDDCMADWQTWYAIAAVIWLLSLIGMVPRYWVARGTTLTVAWLWAIAALVLLTAAALLHSSDQNGSTDGTRWLDYVATVTTFCPIVAVFGAKRPQYGPWRFVVLTLWIILILPVLEEMLVHPQGDLDVHGLRVAFLVILWGLGLGNYIATGLWLPTILIASAQTLLFLHCLQQLSPGVAPWAHVLAAVLTWTAVHMRPTRVQGRRTLSEDESQWLAFRDAFGAVWALRVADRINTMGRNRGWPMRLTWNGIQPIQPSEVAVCNPEAKHQDHKGHTTAEFHRALKTLLKSFRQAS